MAYLVDSDERSTWRGSGDQPGRDTGKSGGHDGDNARTGHGRNTADRRSKEQRKMDEGERERGQDRERTGRVRGRRGWIRVNESPDGRRSTRGG